MLLQSMIEEDQHGKLSNAPIELDIEFDNNIIERTIE